MAEYNEDMDARLTALEGRLAFSEQSLAALERRAWPAVEAKPRRAKRELTAEQKADIRARLVAGQENARLKREAETKGAGKDRKEATDGTSTAED
ncbi:hypothetical protein ACFLX5_06485 [Chloroflexota bacterium]